MKGHLALYCTLLSCSTYQYGTRTTVLHILNFSSIVVVQLVQTDSGKNVTALFFLNLVPVLTTLSTTEDKSEWTATASSTYQDYVASNLVDGVSSTNFQSLTVFPWIQVTHFC